MTTSEEDIFSGRVVADRRGGWILTETVAALAILGLLMTGLVISQHHLGTFNALMFARERCTAAGLAQLDSISATDRQIEETEFARLWPGVRSKVERTAGQGDWTGLTLVKVIAVTKRKGREVKVELSRYVQTPRDEAR